MSHAGVPDDGSPQGHPEPHLLPGVARGPQTIRSFRAVLANTLVANVTSSYLWFALTFWAYLETRSVLATSIIGGSFMALVAVGGVFFGSLVDHHRKKDVMLASAATTVFLYAVAGVMYLSFEETRLVNWNDWPFWLFALVILIGGVVESLRNIALSTTVTLLVPTDGRDKANGLVGTVQGVAFMITSVFSGLSVGVLGMGWTTAIAVALTLVSLMHLLTISIPEQRPAVNPDEPRRHFDVRAAVSAIRAVPGLTAMIIFATFNNLTGGVYMALMDPYGLTLFSVEAWGVVLGVTSVGFIIGGALVARFGLGRNPVRTLLLVNVGVGALGMLFTIRELAWLYVVGILLFMCITPMAEAAEQTILQRVVPFGTQGRVFGFAQSVEAAAAPISAFMIGPIAQFWLIPYMATDSGKERFGWLLGSGEARGIALVLVIAGLIMTMTSLIMLAAAPYRRLTTAYTTASADTPTATDATPAHSREPSR